MDTLPELNDVNDAPETPVLQPRVIRRRAARVLFVDNAGRLLVFHGPTIVKNAGDRGVRAHPQRRAHRSAKRGWHA